ncbi:hypothetical protein [Pseudomonas syringae]|uniref:Phage major capsid protein n=1 Tax=Pseudomonas syringae TaxID=317 RepID=A0A085V5R1_PSESX|nr:hypothetical protein [Pseudomonas syringae]KFE50774.1 hypothetical protein IV02_15215 [Pseudomonas syringae]
MTPFQNKKPDSYTTAIASDPHGQVTGGQIQFNVGPVRKDGLAACDTSVHIEALRESLDDFLNSEDWRGLAVEATPCEFRPFGSAATGQQIALMADQSVTFDPRENWDNQVVDKASVLAGEFIFTEATEKAVLISQRITQLDHTIQAGFTEGAMMQTAQKLLLDIELHSAGQVAKALSDAPSVAIKYVGTLTGKPVEKAEDLLDLLAESVNPAVGVDVADFIILIPSSMSPTLNRAAQRAGLEDAQELLGTGVQAYSGTDYGVFMLPKSFTSVSYRGGRNGDVWHVEATRNASMQGWDLEIRCVFDLLANAMVKVKLDADGLQTDMVPFKMIQRLVFADAPTGG